MQGSIRNNKNLNLTQNQILMTIKQFWIKIPESNNLKTILNNKDNFEIRCSSVVWMGLQISTEAGKNTRTGSEFLPTISTWVANYLKKSKTTICRDHYDCCVYNLCNVLIVLKIFQETTTFTNLWNRGTTSFELTWRIKLEKGRMPVTRTSQSVDLPYPTC